MTGRVVRVAPVAKGRAYVATRAPTKVVCGNPNEGKGLFAPVVVITRNIVGTKRFNQIRGKGISLHSQVVR